MIPLWIVFQDFIYFLEFKFLNEEPISKLIQKLPYGDILKSFM
jgi:hypothetical protein